MPAGNPIRLLVVEDNEADADLTLEAIIRLWGEDCVIDAAGSLGVALDKLGKSTPDAVILDLHLPDSKPQDTVRAISSRYSSIPIIVLTGSGDEGTARASLMLGAQDYIFKSDLSRVDLKRAVLYSIERKWIEAALKASNENLDRANSILAVTSEISREILEKGTDIDGMLDLAGTELALDFLFILCCNDGGKVCKVWSSGCQDGVRECITDVNFVLADEVKKELCDTIRSGMPYSVRGSELPPALYAITTAAGIPEDTFVVITPVTIGGEPWGLFGYCAKLSDGWSTAEVAALESLSRIGASVLVRSRKEKQLLTEMEKRFSEIKDRINGHG